MKKTYKNLFAFVAMLFYCLNIYAVTYTVTVLGGASSSGNGRAPQGTRLFINTIYYVSAAELSSSGFVGQTVTQVGYTWNDPAGAGAPAGQDIATTGTLKVYMQNTTDTAALLSKPGTSFAADLVGMTKVLDGTISIPSGAGMITIDVPTGGPGTTPFSTVNGQGVYIAFEYNTTSTLATPVGAPTVNCKSTLASSLRTGQSQASYALASTLAAPSAFRPVTRLGYDQPNNDIAVGTLYTLGQLPNVFTTNHKMGVRIKNTGVNAQTNVPVSLNITGANTFSNTQIIPSIASGIDTLITFAGFTPTVVGIDTVIVSVPSDDILGNNSTMLEQPITSNFYSYKYSSSALNPTGVGFNLSPYQAVFVSKFNTSAPALINEVRINFATSATSPRYFRVILFPDSVGKPGSPSKLASYIGTQQTISAVASQQFLSISPPVAVNGNFYVGVSQDSANTGNFGYAFQPETPVRDSTFYFGEFQSGEMTDIEWTDFLDGGPANFRSAVEVQLYIPTPPNCAIDLAPSTGSVICPLNPVILTWASGGNGPTSYDVYFSTVQSDVDNQLPGALAANVVGTSYNLGSPAAGPTYYWRVVAKNLDGPAPGCSTQSFTIGNLFSCYCIPDHTIVGCDNGNITNVTFNNINNSTTCTPPAYTVFPASGLTTTTINNGLTYSLSVTTDSICIVSVWFDWNQNGVFEATEWSQVALVSAAGVPSTIPIMVPVNAIGGPTGMRIRSRYAGFANGDIDACTPMGSGEAEDYVVSISPCSGTPDPGSTVASSPSICPESPVTLSLQNAQPPLGITYQWQSAPSSTGTWTNVGTNSNTFSTPQVSATWYQCVLTCSTSGLTATSTPIEVQMNIAPGPKIVEPDTAVCGNSPGFYMHVVDSVGFPGGYPPGTYFEWVNYTPATLDLDSLFVNSTDDYKVVITLPAGGCSDTSNIIHADFTGSQAPVPLLGQDSVKCIGTESGSAIVHLIVGGNPMLNYKWYNSSNVLLRDFTSSFADDTLKNVPAGDYTVVVYNNVGTTFLSCAETGTVTVLEPTAIAISATVTNVTCKNAHNGTITVTPSGGSPGYTYLWNTINTNGTRTGLYPGTYTVSVTDSHGCYGGSLSVTIVQSPTQLAANVLKTNVKCGGKCTGSATASPVGGTGPYQYNWSNGSTNVSISSLCAGTYTLSVTDSYNCVRTIIFSITQNPPLVLLVLPSGTNQATASVSGGVAGYSYLWNTVPPQSTSSAFGLSPGQTYKVHITDSKGCTKNGSVTMPLPKLNSEDGAFTNSDVQVYPNPSTGLISINFSDPSESYQYTVKLFDLTNREIFNRVVVNRAGNEINDFDFSDLPTGIYSLNVITTKGSRLIKIVLQ